VRRSRRLVISTLATLGNYVYGFFWYLYQDGTIGVRSRQLASAGGRLPARRRAAMAGWWRHKSTHPSISMSSASASTWPSMASAMR
jgi:hypothetical protein